MRGQECSLTDLPSVAGVTLFNYPSFSEATPVTLTSTSIVNSALQLSADETNGGTHGYVWHNRVERIADGFVSTFTFSASNKANAGDGFTYFVQNSPAGVVDLNGGTGDKLGSFGIPQSVAIKFDFCANRPNVCNQQKMFLEVKDKDMVTLFSNSSTMVGMPFTTSPPLSGVHTVVVSYGGRLLASQARLRVTLNGINVFDNLVGDLSATNLLNGRFAYFGFTASTSYTQTVQTLIRTWNTIIQPSDFAITQYSANGPYQVVYGSYFELLMIRRNSCKARLFTSVSLNVTATIFQQYAPGTDPLDYVIVAGNVSDNGDGSYRIGFQFPSFYQGLWNLNVTANGVSPDSIPWVGGIQSYKPVPLFGGLPIWALVLLLLIILLIIILLSYVTYRLYRYRKKLRENKEFIEAGKIQAELDRLEDGTSYSANPMVGTLDDLKKQLKKNEEELERLRKRGMLGEDQNFTIQQLQKQRDNLVDEMNRLKRQEQESELGAATASSTTQAGTRVKKEFGREAT